MGVLLINIRKQGEDERLCELRENETKSLLKTLSLTVVCSLTYTVKDINVSTYIGSGQAEEAMECARAFDAEEAVINTFISPRQEKNLEDRLGIPVSDREAVILSIFFQNAHSREARLQIEKAEAEATEYEAQVNDLQKASLDLEKQFVAKAAEVNRLTEEIGACQ